MQRSLILVAMSVLVLGCNKKEDAAKTAAARGPELTPVIANALRGLAPQCEVRKTPKRETRLCKGAQSMMTIHLDDQRHIIEIEMGVWAPLRDEARILMDQAVRGLVGDNVVAAFSERLASAKGDPVVIDGIRVNAFFTQAPKENPRYTVTLAW